MIAHLALAVLLLFSGLSRLGAQAGLPDFGADGRAGLTKAELIQLEAGGLVLPATGHKNSRGTSFIEAALVFDRPPAEVWRLLSETEAQHRYLAEIRSLETIWKSEARHCLEFTVKALGRTLVYRAVHDFFPETLSFSWSLEPGMKCDLRELDGFWRLYAFGERRTLARYGSVARPRFPVPRFIREAETRRRTRPSLAAVKKYVDSGGAWRLVREGD